MDELLEYLQSRDPAHIVLGKDDCNLLILGDGSGSFTQVKALLLTVGYPGSFGGDVERSAADLRAVWNGDADFARLAGASRVLAERSALPLLLAGYEARPRYTGTGRLTMNFLAKSVLPPGEMRLYEDRDFARWLYAAMGSSFGDAGSVKPKNRWVADAFHAWSRENLSAFLVKQDFDAVYLSAARWALVEVKRSRVGGITGWRPYREDVRNYDIQSRFAKMIGAPFYTFHHEGGECDDDTPVGCYEVLDVDPREQGSGWMRFRRTVRRAGELLELLETGR